MSRRVAATIALLVLCAMLSAPVSAQRRMPPPTTEAIQLSFAPIAKAASPAVVNVYARGRVQVPMSPFLDDPFFRHFFGNRTGPMQERLRNSLGSGVIVHPSGIIVTNAHVVRVGRDTEIKVVMTDKREFDARVVLQDEKADIAVLQVDGGANGLPHLEFADSDAIEVGDLVLAIGNPFGVGQTVTQGIVSALARSEIGQSDAQVFIQTDAAINPGNSGGALVDMRGRIVGINTAIYSRTGGSHGIGFAIPSNLVRLYVDSAIAGRRVTRPWIGAKFESVSREIAEALGLDRATGVVVVTVQRSSPAARAGLLPGDVVVEADGMAVNDPRALNYRLTTRGIGNTSRLQIIRGTRTASVDLALQAPPEPGPDDVRNLSGSHPLDGARVANIGPWVMDELGLEDDSGVVILSVNPRSISGTLNFLPGDVILGIGGQTVDNIKSLETQLRRSQSVWQVEYKRQGRIMQIQVRT